MKSVLNVVTKMLAVSDLSTQSAPRLRPVDWTREISGVEVEDASTRPVALEAGETLAVFDGSRTTAIDGTTEFDIALMSIGDGSRYRISHSAGTAPDFRTPRTVAVTGVPLTLAVQANGSLRVTAGSDVFANVVVGDHVFVPQTVTGDSSTPFSILNAGNWVVLGKTSDADISLVRPSGEDFSGIYEVVIPDADSDFQFFSAAGVQVGDSVGISDGFAAATQKTFTVQAVTADTIEIVSALPLVNETGVIPTAAGMIFYSSPCRFLYLESMQEVVVRLNGDTSNRYRLQPTDPTDSNQPGQHMSRGPVWSLTLVNVSGVEADVVVVRAK